MRVMESPIKSAQLRAAVAPSIFVDEQNASEAPKAHLLKRPKDQILGWLFSGGTTILYTSKPNHSSERDQDDFVAEEVLKVAPGLACDLGQAVETSPEPACETNDGTEKSVQVQLLMHHEGSQTDEKIILSSTAMQTEPYTCSSAATSTPSQGEPSTSGTQRGNLTPDATPPPKRRKTTTFEKVLDKMYEKNIEQQEKQNTIRFEMENQLLQREHENMKELLVGFTNSFLQGTQALMGQFLAHQANLLSGLQGMHTPPPAQMPPFMSYLPGHSRAPRQ